MGFKKLASRQVPGSCEERQSTVTLRCSIGLKKIRECDGCNFESGFVRYEVAVTPIPSMAHGAPRRSLVRPSCFNRFRAATLSIANYTKRGHPKEGRTHV